MDFQTAIVTGGTGLLGRALVHDLLMSGVKVGLPYRDEKKFRLFRGGVTEGGLLFAKQCDLSDADQAEQFVQWFRDRIQAPVEVLVCCAGTWAASKLGDTSFDKWKTIFDSNLTSTFNIARAVVPEMCVRNFGRVITIGGPAGLEPTMGKGQIAYTAAKAALKAFTEALAAEVWHQDVKVNMVVPSEIVPLEHAKERAGITPEEIVKTIRFLLSDKGTMISGATIKTYGSKSML